jgi:CheY-like chemotaxis protein
MKILIVDDIPANLHLLRALLEAQGFEVAQAENGAEGLARLEEESFDAVISDILMPKMDGYRFCEAVRRDERLRQLPFIVYTSTYNSPEDEQLALAMGVDKYLRKPAPINDILAALREVIRKAASRGRTGLATEEELGRERLYSETVVNKLEQKRKELSEKTIYLHASEEKFRRLAASIGDILWKDPEQPQSDRPVS